jgi:hypothetical protein
MDDNTRRIYEKYDINTEERELENRDIFNKRMNYADAHRNPLRKMSASVLRNAVDEELED